MSQKTNASAQQSSTGAEANSFAWSYSRLSGYELCPRKWAAENHYRTIRREDTDDTNYGKDVHKALELRVKRGKPLPLDLKMHEPAVEKIITSVPGATNLTEVRVAIDRSFEQVDSRSKNVWCRGVIDLVSYNDDVALIVDWKTGKVRPDFDQLDLMAALTFCILPNLKGVVGKFYWTRERQATSKKYPVTAMRGIWQGLLPRVRAFQAAVAKEDFPPRQNFLCQRYCGVTGCEHHPGKRTR